MKKCSYCKEIKDDDSFYKNKCNKKDGLQNTCKICSYILTKKCIKKKREESIGKSSKRDGKTLSLVGMKQEDYCMMYFAMSKLGYNPELDIHIQFCEKWGLEVSKTPRKGTKNKWTYDDCKE